MRLCFSLLVILSLSACAGLNLKPTENLANNKIDSDNWQKSANQKEVVHENLSDKESSSDKQDIAEDKVEHIPFYIPVEFNEKVAEWIDFFTVKDRDRTLRYLERGSALRPHIERILKENEVPPELYFLAMIESGFAEHAKSRAKAVGIWQFMRGTGRNYGLTINGAQDERRNWIKATEAAASYLKDLHNVFGSWYLALAAYNAGEFRIVRSIIQGKTRDFWALAEGKMLPQETLNYVPKFLAAMIVGNNPEKYNLQFTKQEVLEDFETVSVPGGVSLYSLSKATDVPVTDLKQWNEDLISNYTPYSTEPIDLYIAKRFVAKFAENKDSIAKLQRTKIKSYAADDERARGIYIVRHGDNLTTISKNLDVSVRTLMKINGIRHSQIHPGQRLKFYTSTTKLTSNNVYKVRRHDTLKRIASRNHTTIEKIKELNNLGSNKVYRGQKLRLPSSIRYHRVHTGETLASIAEKYNMSIEELKNKNGLAHTKLYPGRRLMVRAEE